MRKTFLLIAGVTVLLSSAAMAQSPRDDESRSDGWRGNWRDDRGGPGRDSGRDMNREMGPGPGRGMERGPWRGQERRGASFMLHNGPSTIAVRCGDEPMQTCVDSAVRLMERAHATMPPPPPPPAGSPPPPPPAGPMPSGPAPR